jgi:hypothetical protein
MDANEKQFVVVVVVAVFSKIGKHMPACLFSMLTYLVAGD